MGLSRETGEALIERLLDASDTVSVIEDDEALASTWTELGAHVARGPLTDADLIERAAQSARTVVVMERANDDLAAVVSAAIDGAAGARPGIRVVVCAARLDDEITGLVSRSGLEHVLLRTGGRRAWMLRDALDAKALATAIDASDDLAGSPRLDLDLRTRASWSKLRLRPPANVTQG
jgi:hypothetical protein